MSRPGGRQGQPAAGLGGLADICPRPADVAVVSLPAGTVIRVHRASAPALGEYRPAVDGALPVIAMIPGDRELLGWEVVFCQVSGLRGVRNGHHRRDRAVWHQAAGMIKNGGVVYVEHERRPWYGRMAWQAVRVRPGP